MCGTEKERGSSHEGVVNVKGQVAAKKSDRHNFVNVKKGDSGLKNHLLILEMHYIGRYIP